MLPVGFTDAEMDVLTPLASALPPLARGDFLQRVAAELAAYPPEARGPGLLHRLAVEAQRTFLKGGPIAIGASRSARGGKWG